MTETIKETVNSGEFGNIKLLYGYDGSNWRPILTDNEGKIVLGSLKAGTITDTTNASGEISVNFASAFGSTPVVIIQIENDVDYYVVLTVKSASGFTVKILKTAHVHSNPSTNSAGSHTHTNPNTNNGGIHDHAFYGDALAGHSHSQGATGGPSAYYGFIGVISTKNWYCATTSGGSPTQQFYATDDVVLKYSPTHTHTHTNPNTNSASAGTPSGGISSSGSHAHSQGSTGSSGSHSHTQGNTGSSNAGNALASTSVTFSYIAMLP